MALGEDLVHRDSREPATPAPTPTIPTSPSTPSAPQLALTPDLWQDFQALQAATHLDTASLIRRLIHQYDRSSHSDGSDRPASTTATDTTLCVDHHAASPCGEMASFGEDSASFVGDMGLMTADFAQTPSLSADLGTAGEEDCVILDLSSGVRTAQNSLSPAHVSSDVKTGYSDDAEDGERPLDLSVTKCTRSPLGKAREDISVSKAPEAHSTPSNTLLLSALSHGLLHSAAASPPTAHPREAHFVMSGTAPSPRPVSSSLFNLSELPLAGQRVSFAAQTDQPRSKLGSCSGWSDELQSKQKIVQHFLSLPAGHLMPTETQHGIDGQDKQRCVLKLNPSSSDPFKHFALASAVPYPTSVPNPTSSPSYVHSASTAMQLPTVTSLEFHSAGSVRKTVGGGEEEGVTQPSVAVTLSSLSTSAPAILLDMSSAGLVAGAGGGMAGLSTLNIPLMATGTGGLVAIPFLHTLPDALTTASAATTVQGQLPATSTSTPPSAQPLPSSQSVNDIPPPPPYSAAIAASAQSKKYKARMGRPRGAPKAQKAVPKDMKLLTENTLFPGVYTSILKLPWSKRSRGKSSVKIKDVIRNTNSSARLASVPEQQSVTKQGEPGEMTTAVHHQQGQSPINSAVSTDAVPLSILPMPLLVPELTSTASSTLSPSAATSSLFSSTASVMMVYHNSVMSELGKPLRKRGRPPKLPVLSQLLTENTAYRAHLPVNDQPTSMDTGGLSFIPLTSQPGFQASAVAFPSNGVDSSTIGFAASASQEAHGSIKQEPMEVVETVITPLFPSVHAASECTEDSGCPHHDHMPGATKTDNVRDTDVKCAEMYSADVRGAKLKDTDISGADYHYECKETGERGGAEKGDGGNSFQDAAVESRFHMLANQLGLEIGSPYHTNLVYGQSATAAAKTCLYQPVMLSSQAMVEMKPRRRQLNNLIKPSDDCVYTSFRIRPRNSGRRGGKRGGRRRGSSAKCSSGKMVSHEVPVPEECQANELYSKEGYNSGPAGCQPNELRYKEGYDSGIAESGSAVITERIPGAGEVPQRLYQDLYHCKACRELLPVDNSLPHTCTSPASPPLCACDMCGTMFLSSNSQPEGLSLPSLCEDCVRKSQQHPSPGSMEANPQDHNVSDRFACQPCGVHFVNISDYIQHRRTAHLDKMNRQARKTHTLKTLPCPARGCPRLFHMHAELSRHLHNDHPEEEYQRGGGSEEGDTSPTASTSQQDHALDVDVEVTPSKKSECTEEEQPQFLCSQTDCEQRFPTPLQLLEHVQSCHEGISQWPCPLPGCSRLFSAERHLRVHILIHKDEKPLKCPFCHYRCRQKNALHWHMRKHPECAGQYRKFAGMAADS